MGMRLREAREARDINPRALETELRTTYRHLLAIEEGQTRLFYSDSFYRDLFTRYALCLGFSPGEAQAMVERLYEPIPPLGQAPTPPSGPADQGPATAPHAATPASGTHSLASEAAPAESPETAALPEAQATGHSGQASLSLELPAVASPPSPAADSMGSSSQSTQAGTSRSKTAGKPPARPSNTGLFVIILVGLIAFVWVITRPPEPQAPAPLADPASQGSPAPGPAAPADSPAVDTPASSTVPAPAAPGPATPSPVAPVPAKPPSPGPTPTPAPQTPVPAAAPAAPGPSSAPTQAPAPPPAPAAPPAPSPATPSAPPVAPPAAPATQGAAPKGPELELTFRTKGWVWVRESNDQVREFVVQEGGTVRFQEVPIFIVLPAPDQIDAKVLGRPVSLKRTEDEKNHGRFTRTMLRQAANLGRPSASNVD